MFWNEDGVLVNEINKEIKCAQCGRRYFVGRDWPCDWVSHLVDGDVLYCCSLGCDADWAWVNDMPQSNPPESI